MSTILIKQGTIVTLDKSGAIVRGDLLIENDRIVSIGDVSQRADEVIDATNCVILPGFNVAGQIDVTL